MSLTEIMNLLEKASEELAQLYSTLNKATENDEYLALKLEDAKANVASALDDLHKFARFGGKTA